MRRGGSCRSRATEQQGHDRQTHKSAQPGREWPRGSGQGEPLSGGSPTLPLTSCWPYVVLCLLTISTPKGRGASGTVAVLRTLKNIVFSKWKRGHRATGRVLLQGSESGPHRT